MAAEATLRMILLGEDRSASRALRNVGNTADHSVKKFKSLAKGAAGIFAGGALAAGMAGTIKASVDLEASFSRTMAQVKAATNAPSKAMGDMQKLAMKLGADTTFSANEA